MPDLTVTENILLGQMRRRRSGLLDWTVAHDRARAILAELGYGVRLVRQGPGSEEARLPRIRCRSAHAETVSCGGGRSIAPMRRRTCSRVLLPISAEAWGIEAIGFLRQQIGDVLLQDGLQQVRIDAE
uniref:hypothetical protein n=1 Tax=Elioraea sp. TaxID=2185103 RepID=UPI003F6FC33F